MRAEVKVTKELFENTIMTEEKIFKSLVQRLVSELDFEELSRLFKLTKYDPTTEENINKRKAESFTTTEMLRHDYLEDNGLMLFSAETPSLISELLNTKQC